MCDRSRRTRRSMPALLVTVLALAVAGCASIPTSGPVRSGGDLRLERTEDGVPFIGQPPVPDASPVDIVAGFVQSSADFQNDHEVARLYLTQTARQRWRPQAGTIVVNSSTLAPQPGADGIVTVEANEFGRIDADGSFSRSAPDATVTREFRVEKVSGQWRIAELPDGLMLSTADVKETYRTFSLYFLAPSGRTLVPDPVLLPELPGLTTKLVARLLRGPTVRLRGAVSTAFPDGTELDVSSVPVRDGLATVRLDAAALRADDQTRERMSAQLVWTLKQVADVQKVRITAGGEDLAVSGAPADQSRDAWGTYDPNQLTATPSVYVVHDGRVGRYLDQRFEPVSGGGGTGQPALRTPAVSLDAQRLAAVSADGRTVYVGPLTQNSPLQPRIKGSNLSQPSFDPGNNLWVVDRATGQLIYLADGADRPQEVIVPRSPDGQRPTGVAVSRDGARVALLLGARRTARILVGAVARADTVDTDGAGGERISLVSLHDPVPGLRGVRDLAWADAVSLAVLGSLDGAAPRPYYAGLDGYEVTDVQPLEGAVTITAAPPRQPQQNPLVAGTLDGQLLQFTSGRSWQVIGPGSDPAYPG